MLLNVLHLLNVLKLLLLVSQEIRRHADELISWLRVIGPEVTWSEIMSCDWLRGFLAPPLRSGGDGTAQSLCCCCPEDTWREIGERRMFNRPSTLTGPGLENPGGS